MTERLLRASNIAELSPLEGGSFGGVIFGAEFCPFKLPPAEEVGRARELCRTAGLKFSLSTPACREAHFELVTGWLETNLAGDEEWTANDWGILHWAKERGFKNPVNAGRLLGKQRRDPRVLEMIGGASPREARALRGSLWDDEADVALAVGVGVTGFELDCALQGVERPAVDGAKIILCGPHIAVTLALACPWNEKMLHSPESCPRICENFPEAVIFNDQRPEPLYSAGNAQFVKCGEEELEKTARALGASQIAYSASIPA